MLGGQIVMLGARTAMLGARVVTLGARPPFAGNSSCRSSGEVIVALQTIPGHGCRVADNGPSGCEIIRNRWSNDEPCASKACRNMT
jgi:hypothetical protein